MSLWSGTITPFPPSSEHRNLSRARRRWLFSHSPTPIALEHIVQGIFTFQYNTKDKRVFRTNFRFGRFRSHVICTVSIALITQLHSSRSLHASGHAHKHTSYWNNQNTCITWMLVTKCSRHTPCNWFRYTRAFLHRKWTTGSKASTIYPGGFIIRRMWNILVKIRISLIVIALFKRIVSHRH